MQGFKKTQTIFVASLLLAFSLFFPTDSMAQVDSLLQVLANTSDKQKSLDLHIRIAGQYATLMDSSAFGYARKAILLADEVGTPRKKYLSRFVFGVASFNLSQKYSESIPYVEEAARITEFEIKDYKVMINVIPFLGILYSRIGQDDKNVELLLKGIELARENDDPYNEARCMSNIGLSYIYLGQEEVAREYLVKAYDIQKSNDLKAGMAITASNLMDIAKDSAQARRYLDEILEISRNEEVSPTLLGEAAISYATNLLDNEDYPKSLEWFQTAAKYAEEINDTEVLYAAKSSMITCFSKMNQTKKALELIPEVEAYFMEDPTIMNRVNFFKTSSTLYADVNNFEKAYNLLSEGVSLSDSVNRVQYADAIADANAKFQTAEKDKQIAQQNLDLANQKNQRNQLIIFGISILSLISLISLLYLNRQQKRKREAEFALRQEKEESERLREMDQLKTNFFTNISHELRTPLTLILSPVQDMTDQVQSLPVREKLEVVQNNAGRLLNLVNEIMDLSKIEAGKMDLELSRVDLGQLIPRVFHAFGSLAQVRKIDYKLEMDIRNPHVELDRNKFEKILNNLLSNAIKFSRSGDKVIMKAQELDQTYAFSVEDSGQGIHPDDQGRIFDRFYQAQKGGNSLQGGTGVGLALSKEFAQLMGGDIELKSSLGQGSNFRLELPLIRLEPPSSKQEIEVEELSSSKDLIFAPIMIKGEKPRLLVVEDNPQMGKYLIGILSSSYQCVLAPDGQEGLKQLRLNSFDCILSDVMMPNMDGFEFREKVNENSQWKQIPFILLTARYLEADKLKGFKLGIDDYVTKPFSTLELQARIHNLIQNKLDRDNFLAEEAKEIPQEELNVDQQFIQKLEALILESMTNPQFGVESLAAEMNYSSKQLGRNIKRLTGLTTVKFILEVRLLKARDLLERRLVNSVLDAQLAVGIDSPAYFSSKFTQRFGKNPKEVGQF